MTDLILLAALLPGPRHGYALKSQAALVLGQRTVHNNLLYPLFAKFQKAGWVSRRSTPGERGQTRALYSLTAKGRAYLVRRLGEFTEKDADSSEAFRLRVGLFALLPSERRAEILDLRDAALAASIARLRELGTTRIGLWAEQALRFTVHEREIEREWIASLRKSVHKD